MQNILCHGTKKETNVSDWLFIQKRDKETKEDQSQGSLILPSYPKNRKKKQFVQFLQNSTNQNREYVLVSDWSNTNRVKVGQVQHLRRGAKLT